MTPLRGTERSLIELRSLRLRSSAWQVFAVGEFLVTKKLRLDAHVQTMNRKGRTGVVSFHELLGGPSKTGPLPLRTPYRNEVAQPWYCSSTMRNHLHMRPLWLLEPRSGSASSAAGAARWLLWA